MAVVTRFAPSPTGFLHIGGARTALFNWLYARRCGGRFLLRIEDTDRQRSTAEAVDAIFAGLRWLGLDWDGDAVFQHARARRHAEAAAGLLASGRAYRCYCTPAELAAMRERARAAGRPQRYDGTWRDRDPGRAPPGIAPAIRLKAPQSGETVIRDLVQGEVKIANAQLDDMVLLRSDGTPTYMLAAVVDDRDMAVTHVIRGNDHLTNAARQLQLFRALEWPPPRFAHVPLIHGADGARLSKRHGAIGTLAYRDLGFLPEAMRNYLLRLGWAHGDDEIVSDDEAREWFDLSAIGRSPARFDLAKLEALNLHYLKRAGDRRLAELVAERLEKDPDLPPVPDLRPALKKLMPAMKARARTVADLARLAAFLARRPGGPGGAPLDAKTRKVLDDATELLDELFTLLDGHGDWNPAALDEAVRAFAAAHGLKLGQVAQPLRAALTGALVSPPIFDVLAALGRDESLARLAAAVGGERDASRLPTGAVCG